MKNYPQGNKQSPKKQALLLQNLLQCHLVTPAPTATPTASSSSSAAVPTAAPSATDESALQEWRRQLPMREYRTCAKDAPTVQSLSINQRIFFLKNTVNSQDMTVTREAWRDPTHVQKDLLYCPFRLSWANGISDIANCRVCRQNDDPTKNQ